MPSARAVRTGPGPLVGMLVCVALLTACGADDPATGDAATEDAAGSASASASASSAPAGRTDESGGLAAGLLPAEAFGEGAGVVPLSREQLRQSAGLAADPGSLEVSPEACREVLSSTQPPLDEYEDAAGQGATVAGTTTVEVLLQGAPTSEAVPRLVRAVQECPEARIGSSGLGEATLTFEALPAPAGGDAAAAIRYTTTATEGGREVSVPALVGLVQDGDRLITLLTMATDGSNPDAAAFTSLLQQAYEVQAEELG